MELFYVGTNDALYHNYQITPNGGAGWSGELSLGGLAKQIEVGMNTNGRLELFYIGTNDALYHNWETTPNGLTWYGESTLGNTAKQLSVVLNPAGELELFYRGMDDALYHNWQTTPNGTMSGQAPLTYKPTTPADAGQKTITMNPWENTSLAIPANKAGCGPNGAFVVSSGGETRIWRTDLSCEASNGAGQCATVSNALYNTPNWPAVHTSFIDDLTASSDNQLVRFANGTLLLLHQGVRYDTPGVGYRGVEFLYKSTDCGANWTYDA